jgi:cell division protein ZapA
MSSNQSRTEVSIHGTIYTISGDTEPDYIQKLASFLNSKMTELAISLPNANPQKLAVLAALNIADELFQYKEMNHTEQPDNSKSEWVEQKAQRLIHLLDEGIIGDIY